MGACVSPSQLRSLDVHLFFWEAQTVKNLPAMLETWVQSPGQEDPPGEGNGIPLQYSCLENSMHRGAWRATVHGIAKSRTRLSDFTFICTLFLWARLSRGPAPPEEQSLHFFPFEFPLLTGPLPSLCLSLSGSGAASGPVLPPRRPWWCRGWSDVGPHSCWPGHRGTSPSQLPLLLPALLGINSVTGLESGWFVWKHHIQVPVNRAEEITF